MADSTNIQVYLDSLISWSSSELRKPDIETIGKFDRIPRLKRTLEVIRIHIYKTQYLSILTYIIFK